MGGADRNFLRFSAAYGVGHFGKSLFWYSSESLFVFYLTEICDLSPDRAGLVVGSALLFSAIADLALLRLFRRVLALPGGVPRLQAAGAVLCAIFFLLFALTAWVPVPYRLSAALISSFAFRAAYAVLDVPQNALLGLAAETPRQRTRLASIRMVGSGLAALTVSGLVSTMISGLKATTTGFAAGCIGLIAIAGAWQTMRTAPRITAKTGTAPSPLRRHLVSAHIAWVLAIGTIGAVAATLLSKLVPYFAAYGLHSPPAGGWILAAVATGSMASQPFWLRIGDRATRSKAIEAACVVLFGSSLCFYPASFAGLWAVLPCALIQGAGAGGVGMSVWAALGDEARRREGDSSGTAFLFALLTFFSKSAIAGATVLLTMILAASPYRSLDGAGEWPLLPLMCLCPILLSGLCLGVTRLAGRR